MNKIILYILISLLISSVVLSQNPEEKYKIAESYEKSGDLINASRLYLDLYQENKRIEKYLDAVVRTYKLQNRFTDLLPITDENININPVPSSYCLHSEILWKLGKTEEANKSWEKAISLGKKSDLTFTVVANSQIRLRLYDKAIQTLLDGRKNLSSNNIFADELSQLYSMTGKFKEATKEILNLFETTRNIALAQGRFSSIMNNPEAKEFIYSLIKTRSESSSDSEYKRLFAWLLRNMERLQEAFEVYKEMDLMMKSKGFEVLQFANASYKDSQYDIALKAYEYLIEKGSASPYIMNGLWGIARTLEAKLAANSKIEKKEVESLIKRYEKIKKDFPKTPTADECSIRIAGLYSDFQSDRINSSKELKELINNSQNTNKPILATALNMLADNYFLADSIAQYENCLKKIISQFSRTAPAEYSQAQYKLYEMEYFNGNTDSAESHFGTLTISTNTDIANDALEKIVLIENNKNYTAGLIKFAEAEKFEKQLKYPLAITDYNDAISLAVSSDLAERAYIKISKIYTKLGNFVLSRTSLDSLISKYPKSIYLDYAFFNLGMNYIAEQNINEAQKIFTDFLVRFPRSIYIDDVREQVRKIRKSGS